MSAQRLLSTSYCNELVHVQYVAKSTRISTLLITAQVFLYPDRTSSHINKVKRECIVEKGKHYSRRASQTEGLHAQSSAS